MTPGGRLHSLFAFLAVALVATVIVAPFMRYGNVSGHDFEFHASSWLDVASQWKQGVLYPRWARWANWGFGEPRFIFYPPASWILGTALGLMLPWRAVPGAFIWLVVMLSGMSMFSLARHWLPPRQAVFAAILYAANPYSLVVIYLRSDFAEFLAAAFFPLLVSCALRTTAFTAIESSPVASTAFESSAVASAPRAQFPARAQAAGVTPASVPAERVTAALAATFALIWLCNAPAGVLATYTVCLLVAVLAIERRTTRPVVLGISAMALGFLLAGFFIVPAAYEQRWVNISRAFSSGLRPEDNFLFATTSDPEHNSFNLIVSAIAVGMLALAGIAAIAIERRRSSVQRGSAHSAFGNFDEPRSAEYWPLLALIVAIAALMFPGTTLLWRWLPKLRFLQFPWRWLGLLAVPFAYFLAAAVGRPRWRRCWQIAILLTIIASGLFIIRHAWWETDDLQVLQNAVASGQGFDGTDEYDPLGDDHYDLPKHSPQVTFVAGDARPEIQIERWAPEEKIIEVGVAQPAQIALRLINYPAWRVEVNEERQRASSPPGTAQMLIKIPAGHNRVRVHFVPTIDRTVGAALSTIGIGVLLLLWVRKKSN